MAEVRNKKEKPTAVRNRIMPNNPELEKQVLGALMADPEEANSALERIRTEYFYQARNKTIFEEIHKKSMSGQPFDITALSSSMTEEVKEKIGGYSYLSEVADSAFSSATLDADISQLQKLTQLREIIKIADTITDKAFNNEDADSVMGYAQGAIYDAAKDTSRRTLVPAYNTADEVINNISDIFNDPTKKLKGLATGFSNLDEKSNGGFLPGQMIVLAARPGYGKTSFAMNIAANVVRKDPNKVVAVFNLEMAAEELIKRLLATYTEIDAKKISNVVSLTSQEFTKIVKAKKQFANTKMYIDDTSGVTASDIFLRSRRLRSQEKRLDLVIIDHMQLIGGDGKRGRYELMTEISRMIKIMAKELEVPVIVLSQTSRDIEKGETGFNGEAKERKPRMSDLRESGAIEQDADMIIFLGKGEFNTEIEDANRIAVTASILKNRSGEVADLFFDWQKDIMTFYPREHVEMINKQEEEKEETRPKQINDIPVNSEDFGYEPPPEEMQYSYEGDVLSELQEDAGFGPKVNPEEEM